MRHLAITLMVCVSSLSVMDKYLKDAGFARIMGGKSAEGKGLMVLYANKAGEWKELAVDRVTCVVDSGTGFVSFVTPGEGT